MATWGLKVPTKQPKKRRLWLNDGSCVRLRPEYPFHDRTVRVTRCGRICIGKRKINLSQVFAGQIIGIKQVDNQVWLVSFMHYDIGFFDHQEARVEPAPNPFTPEKL